MKAVVFAVLLCGCHSIPNNPDASIPTMPDMVGVDGFVADLLNTYDLKPTDMGPALDGCCCYVAPKLPSVSLSSNVMMTIGDSITAGGGQFPRSEGYRAELYSRYTALGIPISFVGSATDGRFQDDGYGGYEIAQIAAIVDGLIAAQMPAVNRILLMIGTNDIYRQDAYATAPKRHAALLDQIHADCPACIVFVSSILPQTNVAGFNMNLVNILNGEVRNNCAARAPWCRFIDGNKALVWGSADFWDNLHPSASGYAKLGDYFFDALSAAQ